MGGDGHGEHVEGRGLMGQVDGANQVNPRRRPRGEIVPRMGYAASSIFTTTPVPTKPRCQSHPRFPATHWL